jgi:putative ABC transport system substrate-binding protein
VGVHQSQLRDRVKKFAEDPSGFAGRASTKFELVVNAWTARILGLAVPPTLLATADEVIE